MKFYLVVKTGDQKTILKAKSMSIGESEMLTFYDESEIVAVFKIWDSFFQITEDDYNKLILK